MLRIMNEQSLFIAVVLLLWCGLFPLFSFAGLELLFSPCVFLGVSASSNSTFPSSASVEMDTASCWFYCGMFFFLHFI